MYILSNAIIIPSYLQENHVFVELLWCLHKAFKTLLRITAVEPGFTAVYHTLNTKPISTAQDGVRFTLKVRHVFLKGIHDFKEGMKISPI